MAPKLPFIKLYTSLPDASNYEVKPGSCTDPYYALHIIPKPGREDPVASELSTIGSGLGEFVRRYFVQQAFINSVLGPTLAKAIFLKLVTVSHAMAWPWHSKRCVGA
jgi:hypothetical protein